MVDSMKKALQRMDKPLFFSTILLCVIGALMVFSASSVSAVLQYEVSPYYFFLRQVIVMTVLIVVGLFFVIRFPTSRYDKMSSLLMIFVLFSLVGLFFYGKVINSAQSWYNLGPISIQPSEFAKSIIIIYLACFFEKHIKSQKRFFYLRPLIASLIVVALVFIQPDLGTAAIIGMLIYLIFMALPFDKTDKDIKMFKIAGTSGIVLIVLLMIFGGNILNSEQTDRLTYKDPCTRYIQKTGYQVCNGMIAMNNGGLFGVGLGNSTQKYMYLPEGHTDFIFPIIVEELGCVSAIIIIIIYLFIIIRLIKISKSAANLRGSIIAYGTAMLLLLHLLINFGGILALIPLTGVPLPLLSYGGSITMNTLFLLFLSLRVSVESKKMNRD